MANFEAELLTDKCGSQVWHADATDPEHVALVMGSRRADLLVVDAPYSARTHGGHDGAVKGLATWNEQGDGKLNPSGYRTPERKPLFYPCWDADDVRTFCGLWLPYSLGWVASITDHVLMPDWLEALGDAGIRYTFPPLPWVEVGSRVRMTGDGPSSWSCQLCVSRPRGPVFSKWGTLPGAYVVNRESRKDRITGGKSLKATTLLVGDYSRRGQLVVDPCLGGGTTLQAALMSGRHCVGIELDRARALTCARALEQWTGGAQVSLFG